MPGPQCSVLSAGPISSWTDNLAHLTSHISPSSHQTLKLHSASNQSDLHWVVTALSGSVSSDWSQTTEAASHWAEDYGRVKLSVVLAGSDGSVHHLVQDEPPQFF